MIGIRDVCIWVIEELRGLHRRKWIVRPLSRIINKEISMSMFCFQCEQTLWKGLAYWVCGKTIVSNIQMN